LDFALGAFGEQVETVIVTLSAESTRASPLNRCEIEVKMLPRSVRVAETGTDVFTAVENAASRLKRSVARALERDRAWINGQPSPQESSTKVSPPKASPPKKRVK
jgi:ribosome-associated translation inhibitor RaiA